jgi:uncharacterized protein
LLGGILVDTYRIVAFDGRGIRGVYTAVLLRRLSQQVPGFLDSAQLLAGTSTGGILALGLAKGMTADELVKLYQDNGAQIFDRPCSGRSETWAI